MSRQLELDWTSEAFGVQEVANFYKKSLPIIVKAHEGFDGIVQSISKDDMYVITHIKRQERVALCNRSRSGKGTFISLPLNLGLKFHVRRHDGEYNTNKAETLAEIHADRGLSTGMELLPNVNNRVTFKTGFANEEEKTIKLENLEVTKIFLDTYLVGFPLPEVNQPYEHTTILPVHMDVELKVAHSLCGGTKQDFKIFMNIIQTKVQAFKYEDIVNGCQEIMLYSEDVKDEDPYEYVTPCDYVRFNRVGIENQPAMDTNALYIPKPPPQRPPRRGRPGNVHQDQTDADDYCNPETTITTTAYKKASPPATRPKPILKSQLSTPPRVEMSKETANNQESKVLDFPPQTKPKPNSKALRHSTSAPTGHITSKNDCLPDGTQSPSKPLAENNSANFPTPSRPTVAVKPFAQRTGNASVEENETKKKQIVESNEGSQPLHTEEKVEYATFSEIPKDVFNMTVDQIASCLHVMNMDKYTERIKELQIDGELLMALGDDELKEFGMSPLEIKKIQMFAHKQWRPRQN